MKTAVQFAKEIRTILRAQGSPEHAAGVQWFFKEEVASHGWYTADLRRLARKTRKETLATGGTRLLLEVADRLFSGQYLEERGLAIELLQKDVQQFGDSEFQLFQRWLKRVISWADHDGMVHYLVAPMILAEPKRLGIVFRWAKSPDRWHRRAAAVALIRGARAHLFFDQIVQVSEMLLTDRDDMVQKGVGWLLRETAKADPDKAVSFLVQIRERAPRLVLRTACETLSPATRTRILGRGKAGRAAV